MKVWFILFIIENIFLVCMVISVLIMCIFDAYCSKRNSFLKAKAELYKQYGRDLIDNIDKTYKH